MPEKKWFWAEAMDALLLVDPQPVLAHCHGLPRKMDITA